MRKGPEKKSPLSSYINFINKTIQDNPVLSDSETRELIAEYRNGDKRALDKLVNSNLGLVIKIARHYISPGVEVVDLIQEGALGLIKGIDNFDLDRDIRLSTYAAYWIRQRITRYIQENATTIRLPSHFRVTRYKLSRASNDFSKTRARKPNNKELALLTGLSVRRINSSRKNDIIIESLNSKKLNRSGEEYEALDIADDSGVAIDKQIEMAELGQRAFDALQMYVRECFKKEDVQALRNMGIFIERVFNERVLSELGKEHGVSRERIRQIQIRQIEILRDRLKSKGIDPFKA